jgi:hypothetical protein
VHLEHGAGAGRALTDGVLEGDVLRGAVAQGPLRLPLEAFRTGSDAAKAAKAARDAAHAPATPAPSTGASPWIGRWEGDLDLGVQKLLLRLDVGSDTQATLDIPAQGLVKGPLEQVARDGAKVRFELAASIGRAVFTGTLDGDRIAGTLAQAGATYPFTLQRKP